MMDCLLSISSYLYPYNYVRKVDIYSISTSLKNNWRPSSLGELTPMIFNMGLTHSGSEASNLFWIKLKPIILYDI